MDSNRRPLASEVTTLPTEPQPLPNLVLSLQQENVHVKITNDRIWTADHKCRKVPLCQLRILPKYCFLKWANPFGLFKQTIQFLQQIYVKMSIQ